MPRDRDGENMHLTQNGTLADCLSSPFVKVNYIIWGLRSCSSMRRKLKNSSDSYWLGTKLGPLKTRSEAMSINVGYLER